MIPQAAGERKLQVKRKRTDEPVEYLYIEDSSKKRRFADNAFYFKRVPETSTKAGLGPSPLSGSSAANEGPLLKPQETQAPAKDAGSHLSVPLNSRRFHLSRSVSSTKAKGTSEASLGDRPSTPIFFEAKQRSGPDSITISQSNSSESLQSIQGSSHETKEATVHKRPAASAAEKQWRQQNWKKQDEQASNTAPPPSTSSNVPVESFLQLVDDVDKADRKTGSSSKSSPGKMRHKPRVPTRRKNRVPAPDAMDVEMMDEGDFVTDIYIRVPISQGMEMDIMDRRVGVLVIEEEERQFWEAWIDDGEHEESEKEWNTDDEDENAEDYYGADYPEDEVASDDEHNRNAYQYQYDASDHGEEDSDDDIYKNDGEDLHRPWKRHPWK